MAEPQNKQVLMAAIYQELAQAYTAIEVADFYEADSMHSIAVCLQAIFAKSTEVSRAPKRNNLKGVSGIS